MTLNQSEEKEFSIAEQDVHHTDTTIASPSLEKSESNSSSNPVRFAGFWMRFWAFLLDLIVIGSIDRLIINPIFRLLDISLIEYNFFAPISIATAITFYVYFVLMTRFFNQTLGKMVFGLRVVDLKGKKLTWGTIIFREWIGRFISGTIVIGYVIVAFLPKKQGLHDIFTDTTVVHEN
nr:RDD family protein [Cytobacillus dafuensis]